MCIEPYNDPYHPYILPAAECALNASEVYRLLEQPEKFSFYIHGDAHDTIEDVRRMAYAWLERFLVKKERDE